MKKILISFLLSFIAISPCLAAEATFNGIYLGGGGGYGSGNTKFTYSATEPQAKTDFSSPMWEVDAGLGHSLLHFLYLGLGAKYQDFSNAKVTQNTSDASVQLNNAIFGVLTPGVLITQKTLLYLNLGVGEVNAKYSQNSDLKPNLLNDSPHNSWSDIYGIGLKQGLNNYISIGLEFNHVNAGSAGISNNISSLSYNETMGNLTFYL